MTTTTGLVQEPDPSDFEGSVADFYRVPDRLPPGSPGQLIRVQTVSAPSGGGDDGDGGDVSVRIMYHSRDVEGHDRAVTGTVTYPTGPAPDGGWPVVAWAHGTTGLSSACAPSRAGGPAPGFGIEGVRVATDYLGLGPVGERHPYLSGLTEGYSVVDAVRAAVDLDASGAGTQWVAVGHSQGGHAALFANQLGQERAPELDLVGTVAIAPAAALAETFGPSDQLIPRMVGIMALYGLAADYPELDPDDYVGPEAAAAAPVIDEGCSQQVIAAMAGIDADTFYDEDPRSTEPAKSILEANDPGQVAVDSPLLLVGGGQDNYVVPARIDFFFDQLCDIGQRTKLVEEPGANHGSVVAQSGRPVTAWLEARLAGKAAPTSCP